jgi:hypothetical protein
MIQRTLPNEKELVMPKRKYVEYSEQTDSKRYPSDLTDAEWKLVEAFVQQKAGPGRPHEIDRREILNGLFEKDKYRLSMAIPAERSSRVS